MDLDVEKNVNDPLSILQSQLSAGDGGTQKIAINEIFLWGGILKVFFYDLDVEVGCADCFLWTDEHEKERKHPIRY